MRNDEEQIRALVSAWHTATRAGDVDAVLRMMTDDVVFLVPGRPPMRKDEFASLTRAATTGKQRIESTSEIQEIQVAGDWAFMWSKLSVTATSSDGAPPAERAGHTLTIFERGDGQWLLARDANLLAPVQRPSA
jgi:uncharacterized protein (TIGR02246 family)